MLNHKATPYIAALIFSLLLYIIGYQLQRYETTWLILVYSFLFALYARTINKCTAEQLSFWIASAIGFRILLLFAIPNLSDDFYRFIWDGRLLASGHHPFAQVPSFYFENQHIVPGIDEGLYLKLNSKNYFTIYPPVAQFLFWFSATLSSTVYGSLMVIKLSILLAEVGSIFLLKKLLTQFNIPVQRLLIYALNPLVIIELCGNAHFEGIMVFFILLTFYFLAQQRLMPAAFFMAISIGVKLIPLIFLPAILPLLGWKRALLFYAVTAAVFVLVCLPLLDRDIIIGFTNSIGYYFSKFEFNASLYYLVRGLGYLFWGYNIIQTAGWVLGITAGALIITVSLTPTAWRNNANLDASTNPGFGPFFHSTMWSLLIYFLFTTTLHPWYIVTLLATTVLTGLRFGMIWTFVIFFTYAGYSLNAFEENLWLVGFEYVIVLGYLAYEFLWKKNQSSLAV